jgi:tetratricopeptide (TPR) repeat protein
MRRLRPCVAEHPRQLTAADAENSFVFLCVLSVLCGDRRGLPPRCISVSPRWGWDPSATKKRRLAGRAAVALACGVLTVACTSREAVETQDAPAGVSVLRPPDREGLQPVALPDFAPMKDPVRRQMETRYSALMSRIKDPRATASDLGAAYGEMGMILMAAAYFDAAESCYLNAQALAPGDRRWPYYLGHLYKIKGPLAKSVEAFERALRSQPSDVATLVWLGDAYLAQGRAEAAEPLFATALTLQPDSAAARFGAGRTALARKDYDRTVRHLTRALALDPQATRIHYPLAMAYRALGDLRQAQAHLAQQGDVEPHPVDPLKRQLDELLQSPEAYDVRGGREFDAGNWAAAVEYFRKGLELAPADPSLRHRLGTALYQMGDVRGATEQFEQVVRTSPHHARAHFSLGVLMNESGRYAEAIDRFSDALKYEPGYVQARVQLAGILGRTGRPEEALAHYTQALEVDPTLSDAAFGHAMTLVRLHRYREARERLVAGVKTHPDQSIFRHALARLLAAAPDDRVRDGPRAKTLVDELLKEQQSIELAETTGMMLAELGEYDQAVTVQRDAIAAAEQQGLRDVLPRLTENLRLYERGQPCRRPFTEGELP